MISSTAIPFSLDGSTYIMYFKEKQWDTVQPNIRFLLYIFVVVHTNIFFLLDGLFHRILTRAIRWSQECGGHEPQLFYRKAKFYLDPEHDYVLEMAPLHFARITVSLLFKVCSFLSTM